MDEGIGGNNGNDLKMVWLAELFHDDELIVVSAPTNGRGESSPPHLAGPLAQEIYVEREFAMINRSKRSVG